ncbi:hypothetical protein Tco_0225994 [Tanacetum coccineum]
MADLLIPLVCTDIDFEDNLFGLYGDEDLTNLAKCLIIENEDFVKEIAVCLYIRSMSSTSWIVQDIRHKLGRFNFFIKISGLLLISRIRTRFSSRGYEEKKVMDIDFEDNLFGLYGDEDLTNLAKCLIIENEDFVKEIAVCLYIRSMSSTSWIVQDIRHKLGRFNFFIKISGLLLISRIRTRFSSRGYEEKKVMDIDFEDNLFGLYGDEDLTNLAKSGLLLISRIRTRFSSRGYEEKKVMENDGDIMFVEIIKKYDDFSEGESDGDGNAITGEKLEVEYFDKFLTRSELSYHKYLICALIPSLFLRNPIIVGGSPSNLKIPCNIGHVRVEKAYIDPNSPINIMTRMQYNWIIRKQLEPWKDPGGIRRISNFTRRIRGMHIFVGNFTYVSDSMIVEDISSIIDPRLSQVVLGKPFVEISNMIHDLSSGIVKFANGTDEIAYNMPHKIEQFNSLTDLEKEHTKSVYFRNEETREEE